MLSLLFLLLGCLALGPRVVLSASFKFNFTSTVQQCEPVSITFAGNDDDDAVPSSLTLLPFNSKPFSIPIPNAASNSTGVTVTFLPLEAGTQFVASLDDASGDNSARVSDVFRVFPSPTGNRACLPANNAAPPLFTLPQIVSQCEIFNVRYTTATPPRVRAFFPKGPSFELNKTVDIDENTAGYMLVLPRRSTVLLMAFDGTPERGMTTDLLTVQGDSSSSNSCFPAKSSNSKDGDKEKSRSTVPQGLVIGLSVGGSVILLLSALLALYLIRRRRRKQRIRNIDFDPSLLEKRSSYSKGDFMVPAPPTLQHSATFSRSPSHSVTQKSPYSAGYVENPPYTATHFSPTMSDFDRPQTLSPLRATGLDRSTSHKSPSAPHINPYDIEQMLNYASDPASDQRVMKGNHLWSPSEMPVHPTNGSNPFGDGTSERVSYASSSNFEIITRPSLAATAIVSSPRSGLKPPSSRFSDPSMMDSGSVGASPRLEFNREDGRKWENSTR